MISNEQLVKSYRKTKDEAILWQLINQNMGLVKKIAFKYTRSTYSDEDAIQDGIIGLIKSIDEYDAKKGKFITWAYWHILKGITEGRPQGKDYVGETVRVMKSQNHDLSDSQLIKKLKKDKKVIVKPSSLPSFLRPKTVYLDAIEYNKKRDENYHRSEAALAVHDPNQWEVCSDLEIIIKKAPKRTQEILRLRASGLKLAQIGKKMGLSTERTRTLMKEFIDKYRKENINEA